MFFCFHLLKLLKEKYIHFVFVTTFHIKMFFKFFQSETHSRFNDTMLLVICFTSTMYCIPAILLRHHRCDWSVLSIDNKRIKLVTLEVPCFVIQLKTLQGIFIFFMLMLQLLIIGHN